MGLNKYKMAVAPHFVYCDSASVKVTASVTCDREYECKGSLVGTRWLWVCDSTSKIDLDRTKLCGVNAR